MEAPEIKRLDEAVINRIAAGEVVQRPANALKEMIENSLDAKSTNIQVVVKEGGLKLLQIQDNGTGIRREDFEIVCERFTTSKLQNFEDLQQIATYGFRGEALASISHIAHLTITSKTSADICAYKAIFVDGKLQSSPLPTAGNQGTLIAVEDLFFNMHVRRRALRSAVEEYQKISEVVGKYAIHNASVGFALRKQSNSNDIRTQINSTNLENIRTIYGNQIAKELIEFDITDKDALKFQAKGLMSNANYSTKKFTFLLFINHRLVDCPNLKRCIGQVYATYLPKNSQPFIYLSLELDATQVDVNVHPTKHEVHFLNEEQIISAVCNGLEAKLLASNNSRMFYTQAKLPGAHAIEALNLNEPEKKIQQKDMVRTDASEQKIEKFLKSKTKETTSALQASFVAKVNRIETQLKSVIDLRHEIESNSNRALREIFAQHVFVGCIDPSQALIQHGTKLYLCNVKMTLFEYFYQSVLYNFENFQTIKFESPLRLLDLALTGLEQAEVGWTSEDGDKAQLATRIVEILSEKAEMLAEYFSMGIVDGRLESVPLLLEQYVPDFGGLPVFVVRLATEVNWDEEKGCFETIARELAYFCCEMNEEMVWEGNNWQWITEHVVFPTMKQYFIPPKEFADNVALVEVANLPNLYKVFERC